jgi:UTP---glucose-1-phosphate uridylyltransferase
LKEVYYKIVLDEFLKKLSKNEIRIIDSIISLGQADILFQGIENNEKCFLLLKNLLFKLIEVDNFYRPLGGLKGYHNKVIELKQTQENIQDRQGSSFYMPKSVDIREKTSLVDTYIDCYLENMPYIAEVYPLGGAGDRLGLFDEETKNPLPGAILKFGGITLLQRMILDLEAREYLYYKKYNKQIITPIAMMTSDEKDNHQHVLSILKENNWFNRPKDSFKLFKQILVPVIAEDGLWAVNEPLDLVFKPGGHGALWKQMVESNVFLWLKGKKIRNILIRQINNPIAGIDYGLLAFMGYGILKKKSFGFAACKRVVDSAEGVDVLCQKKEDNGYYYNHSNIEYTDFAKYNIEDVPFEEGTNTSKYPSNTNILFASLEEVEKSIEKDPYPGQIVNFKTIFSCLQKDGTKVEKKAARLEIMMQNIADNLKDFSKKNIESIKEDDLQTFVSFNKRLKTISVTKKQYEKDSILETPVGCYLDLLKNYHDLLKNYCSVTLPKIQSEEDYLKKGPSFVCFLHPALGPIFENIAEKINKGEICLFSELQLDIAELSLKKFKLNGSLLISSKCITKVNNSFSTYVGKCELVDVNIINDGIDRDAENTYWKNDIKRKESLQIILNENSHFYAEGVTFKGNLFIEVPKNTKMTAYQDNNILKFEMVRNT